MAATDQNYRGQKRLDLVFGVSCALMLLSIILLFAEDYYRGWKKVQRKFRDVDEAVTQRLLMEDISDALLKEAGAAEKDVAQARADLDKAKDQNNADIKKALADRDKKQETAAGLKADYDSVKSLYNIAVEHNDEAGKEGYKKKVDELGPKLAAANRALEDAEVALKKAQAKVDEAEKALADKEDRLKKLRAGDVSVGDVDRLAKALAQKRFGTGDWVRSLPVIDGFASPFKIKQVTLDDYPIDYNFKHVTRYDRCQTCHLGIEQDKFSREALKNLGKSGDVAKKQALLDRLRDFYERRKKNGESLGFDPGDLPKEVRTVELSDAEVSQFCVHPRLDLFVGANSAHPVEKFGCTSCHAGQGSATSFDNASHVPTDTKQKEEWQKNHGWAMTHAGDWEFPMLPRRFVEASCLKCHHQVTDLVRHGSKEEAPKLLRGYNLVRENGCFGCHEIAGLKNGRPVGPDLRLEPPVPLELLSPAEREKVLADKANPPGMMRKVGPSLYRVSEKVDPEWLPRWVMSPRGFRHDTKMPHFYGLSNNRNDVLPADQKGFPDAEVHAIAYYLEAESKKYLEGNDLYYRTLRVRLDQLQADADRLSAAEQQELADLKRRLDPAQRKATAPSLHLQEKPVPIAQGLKDSEGNPVTLPDKPAMAQMGDYLIRGARLFREKGCLACHAHEGTAKALRDADGPIPAVSSDATFAPNLSHVAAKLGGDEQAQRRWLVQWIMNPTVHHPRTRMPVTHLGVDDAAAVADWLLSEGKAGPEKWDDVQVPAPEADTLRKLTKVYLAKAPGVTQREVDKALEAADDGIKGFDAERVKQMTWDADERELLARDGQVGADALKWYVGRKAISRQGCYACHDVPGFEAAKPIGTALNDWGKKDPERLAFENIDNYAQKHYHFVDQMAGKDGKGPAAKGDKEPYEKYFYEALEHRQRDGFLHQKLVEPRSYDYDRELAWDDRLRMPQFRFARGTKPLEGETQEQADARAEAEAREAVMTFVLGLVAEPTPLKYVYQPGPDRLAEVRGRQVLDKYNCAGCHQVRPGVYEFKPTKDALEKLLAAHGRVNLAGDYPEKFPEHDAWAAPGLPRPAGRLLAYGVVLPAPPDEETEETKGLLTLRLAQALRFEAADDKGEKQWYTLPAGEQTDVPVKALAAQAAPYGGAFADLLTKYGVKRLGKPETDSLPPAKVPPSLLHEGEKVQPEWLYQFLLDPKPVRPTNFMYLRMPRFNLSPDEARALVDYFASAEKLENPGIGLTNPYLTVAQHQDKYWTDKAREYAAHLEKAKGQSFSNLVRAIVRTKELEPTWAAVTKDQLLPEKKKELDEAEARLKEAKDDAAKVPAQKLVDDLKKQVGELEDLAKQNKYPESLRKNWEEREVYATDAYRLLTYKESPCLACHNAGPNFKLLSPQGPPLELGYERLRPDWTERWLANPRRLYIQHNFMPQNYPRDQQQFADNFHGDAFDRVRALNDVLMNFPKVADLPANRSYRVQLPGEKK